MKKLDLCGTWKWSRVGIEDFHSGHVPGSVYSDMLKEGMIDNPFWRDNEYAIRELMMDDYLYTRDFEVAEEDLQYDSLSLVAEGLDTIADISINGNSVAAVCDMHRTYRFDVKKLLKTGTNRIDILFHSSLKYIREKDAGSDIFYASTGCIHGNGYLRKAHYMFGWDWGPQLPDAGIFRPIYIEARNTARLSDFRIRQIHKEGKVFLRISSEVEWYSSSSDVTLSLSIRSPKGEEIRSKGKIGEDVLIEIPSPLLWWPNNLGPQPLYDVSANLQAGKNIVDSRTCRIGLRTITVSTEKDEYGNEFCFVVNGQKIFAMGANYVPQDNLITRVDEGKYRGLVHDAALANFNCIRVWGGGYYPDDSFYDACDEYGILIWQDLMFACNVYTLEGDFEDNIIEETKDNIRRIRHHASLALICGNNEMEWGWADEWARIKGHHPRYKADYVKIFELILPRAVESVDDQTFFWESSPSSGGALDNPNDTERGDQHYWDVWHSGKPFTEYRKHYFRFCSEYGFQSFPSSKTIASFTLPSDRNIFSRVMESHQKNGTANSKIFQYVSDYYLYPSDLDNIAYISQVLQLRAIQYGVEHWRRNRPRCMGSLYWQLNDCWPVASWASIDYYGRWKALHYGARHFYAPVTVSACEEYELSPNISYWILNETDKNVTKRLEIDLIDTSFKVKFHTEIEGIAAPFSSSKIVDVDFSPYLMNQEEKSSRFARVRMFDGDELEEERITLFVKPKHFNYRKPEYKVDVSSDEENYLISVRSDTFAQFIELDFRDFDAVLSDNFFDLTSAEGIKVRVKKSDVPSWAESGDVLRNIKIRSIADSYTLPEK